MMKKYYNVYLSNTIHVLTSYNSFEEQNNLVEWASFDNKEEAENWINTNTVNEDTTVFLIEVYKLDKNK